jgi:RNase P protein component
VGKSPDFRLKKRHRKKSHARSYFRHVDAFHGPDVRLVIIVQATALSFLGEFGFIWTIGPF